MKFVWDKKRKLLFFINKLLPFKSFKYFNFFGVMVTRIKDVLKDFTDMAARHEGTHTIQMLEVGILPYYPLYVLEFLIKLIIYRNWHTAYKAISLKEKLEWLNMRLIIMKAEKSFNTNGLKEYGDEI